MTLLVSSLLTKAYHDYFCGRWVFCKTMLFFALVAGVAFLCLQHCEFLRSSSGFVHSSYYSCSLIIVSLHLLHVFLGILFLLGVYFYESKLRCFYQILFLAY